MNISANHMCFALLLLMVCIAVHSSKVTSNKEFEPLCDIHTKDYGPHTPTTTLPQHVKYNEIWLFPTKQEIEKYYQWGKRQCETFISDENERKVWLHDWTQHAPVYPQTITGRGQLKCRGRGELYDITGKVVWPFGPGITESLHNGNSDKKSSGVNNGKTVLQTECSTYSKCWFGLLSCGTFKESHLFQLSKDEIEKARVRVVGQQKNTTTKFPSSGGMKWSMKSLVMQLRVLGPEIIVPEQRLVHVSAPADQRQDQQMTQEDVIIAQYFVTIPSTNYSIEMRHFEFYPSSLLAWKMEDFTEYHVENFGMIYLGGSEGRCRPWTRCELSNICCGCDEQSFVAHTPLSLTVDNAGAERCLDKLSIKKPESLPLCKINKDPLASNPPGRWIQSNHPSLPKKCKDSNSYNIAKMSVPKELLHTKEHLEKLAAEDQVDAHLHHGWYEASGNPCIRSDDKEELDNSHWFFAPYSCKYHFYERHEIHQCLRDMKIGHIHFQGDSMSRELFSLVSSYLGVPQVSEANLKHMTNNMQMKDIRFHSGAVVLSEGYSWDFNPSVLKLSELPPLPNVIIANYALAHRTDHLHRFRENFEATEYKYWTVDRNQSLPKPQFLIFQGARDLHGRRTNAFEGNIIREASDYLKQRYGTLGFIELEEYPITAGRYDLYNKHTDGWHFMGTARQMEVIILFNIICNEWLKANASASAPIL